VYLNTYIVVYSRHCRVLCLVIWSLYTVQTVTWLLYTVQLTCNPIIATSPLASGMVYRASAHRRFWPPWIEHINVNQSGRTSHQFTAAVLKTQTTQFSWRSGGRLGKWNKWNKWMCMNGRPNNRSRVFSVLCSTPSIESSLPPSSFSHNDWK